MNSARKINNVDRISLKKEHDTQFDRVSKENSGKDFVLKKMQLEIDLENAKTSLEKEKVRAPVEKEEIVSKREKTKAILSLLENGKITFEQCKELMTS